MTPLQIDYKAFRKTFRNAQLGYCDPTLKDSFLRRGVRLLEKLAADLGIPPGLYRVWANRGGIAGSGEIRLQSGDLYVQLDSSPVFAGAQNLGNVGFMVRWVESMETGARSGPNNFAKLAGSSRDLLALCRRVMENKKKGEKAF